MHLHVTRERDLAKASMHLPRQVDRCMTTSPGATARWFRSRCRSRRLDGRGYAFVLPPLARSAQIPAGSARRSGKGASSCLGCLHLAIPPSPEGTQLVSRLALGRILRDAFPGRQRVLMVCPLVSAGSAKTPNIPKPLAASEVRADRPAGHWLSTKRTGPACRAASRLDRRHGPLEDQGAKGGRG